MREFVSKIMGAIGVAPGPHTKALSKEIGRRYLNRMADRDENMGALRDKWNAEHKDDGKQWMGEGFLSAIPESGEQKGAEAAAAEQPAPPAAEQAEAPPAAEQEEAPPQQEEGSNKDWHKKPTISGETIDKKRAAEIMNSESNIRSMQQEEPAYQNKGGLFQELFWGKQPSQKPLVPSKHPNPPLFDWNG